MTLLQGPKISSITQVGPFGTNRNSSTAAIGHCVKAVELRISGLPRQPWSASWGEWGETWGSGGSPMDGYVKDNNYLHHLHGSCSSSCATKTQHLFWEWRSCVYHGSWLNVQEWLHVPSDDYWTKEEPLLHLAEMEWFWRQHWEVSCWAFESECPQSFAHKVLEVCQLNSVKYIVTT